MIRLATLTLKPNGQSVALYISVKGVQFGGSHARKQDKFQLLSARPCHLVCVQSLQQQLSLANSSRSVVQRDVDSLRQEVADGLKEVRQSSTLDTAILQSAFRPLSAT
jgi:hypothetical protein